MTGGAKRRPIDCLIPAVVVLLVAAILLTSRWQARDRYFARESFAGCYRDSAGSFLELGSTGIIHSVGKRVGTYKIVSPVGGKHGYLVEVSNLQLQLQDDNLVAQPGSGGFLWPISPQGELTVTFAPDTKRSFHKGPCELR